MIHYGPGKPVPQASQPASPIIEELASGSRKPKHSSDADDAHFLADPLKPPGLPGGGPPGDGDDDDDDDFDDKRGHKDKKDKKKGRKTSVEDPGADVVGILHLLRLRLHRLPRPVRILRVLLHERSRGPWSVLGLLIIRPKSLIGS